MNHIYIFEKAIQKNANINVTLDDKNFLFASGGQSVDIRTDLLSLGSSTCIVENLKDEIYPLYNFRELLEITGTTPNEFLQMYGVLSYVQIDKIGKEDLFIKIFLPVNQQYLNGFHKHYCTMDELHSVDRRFSWSVDDVNISGDKITLVFNRAEYFTPSVYLSHAGQSFELRDGYNDIPLSVCDDEIYFGLNYNGRYVGRKLTR